MNKFVLRSLYFLGAVCVSQEFAFAQMKFIPPRGNGNSIRPQYSGPLPDALDEVNFYTRYGGETPVQQYGWSIGYTLSATIGQCTMEFDTDFEIVNDNCSGHVLPPGAGCYFTAQFIRRGSGFRLARQSCPWIYTNLPFLGGTVTTNLTAEALPGVDPEPTPIPTPTPTPSPTATPSPTPDPNPPPPSKQACKPGSIIRADAQSLSEVVAIVGAPFSMFYSTENAHSYVADFNTVNRLPYFNPNGWTVSIHHFYDLNQQRLFKGTGSSEIRKHTSPVNQTILVVSSDGSEVYVFDLQGRHLETKTSLTGATKFVFEYGNDGRLAGVVDSFGNRTSFIRSTYSVKIESPYHQITILGLNLQGLVASIANPMNEAYRMTYKAGTDLLETFTKPEGQVSQFTYDSEGRLVRDLGNGGDSTNLVKTLLTNERRLELSSTLGRKTTYSSRAEGQGSFRTEVSSSGQETQYGELFGGSFVRTNEIEHGTKTTPDARFGDLFLKTSESYVSIEGIRSTSFYSSTVNRPASPSSPFDFFSITESKKVGEDGPIETTVFDKSSKTFTTTSPEGAVVRTGLDNFERPVSAQIGSDIPMVFEYTPEGKLSRITQGNRVVQNNIFNEEGLLETSINASNIRTDFSYDAAGRIVNSRVANSFLVAFSYDRNGNLKSITPPNKPAHQFLLNALELPAVYRPPSLVGVPVKDTVYSYNQDKQLTSILRPDRQSVSFEYDQNSGDLKNILLGRGAFSFQYRNNSKLLANGVSPDHFKNEFDYYGSIIKSERYTNQLSSEVLGSVGYGFDSQHRVSSRTVQRGSKEKLTSTYLYNGDGKPTQVGKMNFTYEYPSGRLSTTHIGKIVDYRTYDSFGQLKTYQATFVDNSSEQILYSYELERDAQNRIVKKIESASGVNNFFEYSYDDMNRLSEVKKNGRLYSKYVYDQNGNRVKGLSSGRYFTASFDQQDRIQTYNVNSALSKIYSYNENGDIVAIKGYGSNSKEFGYDAIGKLLYALLDGDKRKVYQYDSSGRNVAEGYGLKISSYRLYQDDIKIAAQISNVNRSATYFTYATRINTPDYMTVGDREYKFIADHLGSPRLVVDSENGRVVQVIEYSDFGEVLMDSQPGFQPYGFAGGIYDSDTKLVRFGARDYDAETGRWVSKDPILFKGGDTDLYSFVGNDPINNTDPKGTGPWLGGVCALISGYQFTSAALENSQDKAIYNSYVDLIQRQKLAIDKEASKDCPNEEALELLQNQLLANQLAAAKLLLKIGNNTQGLTDLVERIGACAGLAAISGPI